MPGKSITKKYRLLPLIGVGALVFIILVLLSLLIWSVAAYGGQRDPSQSGGTAAFVYLAAVFISCAVMTLLIRGGTVFPSAILGLAAAIVSLLLAPAPVGFGKILFKILMTLLIAAAGFAVAKLCCRSIFPSKRQPVPVRQRESLSRWEDDSSISEPGK